VVWIVKLWRNWCEQTVKQGWTVSLASNGRGDLEVIAVFGLRFLDVMCFKETVEGVPAGFYSRFWSGQTPWILREVVGS
jgi:hypothetical protein